MGRFKKATGERARLKVVLDGGSKSGKSFVAQVLARDLITTLKENGALSGNGRVAVIDSEGGRVNEHYGMVFDFDDTVLQYYAPEYYQNAIRDAIDEKYSVIIVDQISHEWEGKDGVLAYHSQLTNASRSKNGFITWREATPKHDEFIDTLTRCPAHLICTMRCKQKHEQAENGAVTKLGMQPVQRDTTEYEFDIYGRITENHHMTVQTRGILSALFENRPYRPGKGISFNPAGGYLIDAGEIHTIARTLGEWISGTHSLVSRYKISIDQINEIKTLGETAGVTPEQWQNQLNKAGVSSVYDFTPELYTSFKKSLLALISKKKETVKA
jgi:hypothetical protein